MMYINKTEDSDVHVFFVLCLTILLILYAFLC